MNRRQLLQALALTPLWPWLPRSVGAAARGDSILLTDRVLVLVELKGGNDGLNTLVPYTEPEYYRLRPRLAIAPERVLPLDAQLGLNPALAPLWPAWREGELAFVLGVGYPKPNRSHFRSMDIWETASDSDEALDRGWIAQGLQVRAPGELPDVVILGGDDGPVRGGSQRVIAVQDLERFTREAARLAPLDAAIGQSEALAHVLAVRASVYRTGSEFQSKLGDLASPATDLPPTAIGRQLQRAARMLISGLDVPVLKVQIGSFDTHHNQSERQDRLLGQLAEALAAFRTTLSAAGLWDRVLVMTYSEFGRRVAENASRGTDHGAAAPQLFLGGRVRGGLYGEQPTLTDLECGDLRYAVDFRRLYATVVERWWGGTESAWQTAFPALDVLDPIAKA